MQTAERITRDNWAEQARAAGVRLESICHLTGKNFPIVYKYSRGERQPSDEWIAHVAAIIEGARLRGGAR